MENCNLVPTNDVHYREVSAIEHVRYREVPLYDIALVNMIIEGNMTLVIMALIHLNKS